MGLLRGAQGSGSPRGPQGAHAALLFHLNLGAGTVTCRPGNTRTRRLSVRGDLQEMPFLSIAQQAGRACEVSDQLLAEA